MGYELKVDGMAELSELLNQMEEAAPGVAAGALYEGAGVVADALNKGAESIKTEPFHYVVFPGHITRLLRKKRKSLLQPLPA